MGLRQIGNGIKIAVKTFSLAEGNVNVQSGKLGIISNEVIVFHRCSTTPLLDGLGGREAGKLGCDGIF